MVIPLICPRNAPPPRPPHPYTHEVIQNTQTHVDIFLGTLILLNTFASDVIFTIALPLILFWRKQTSRSETADQEVTNYTGEFAYHENLTTLCVDTFRVCAIYQVCKAFKVSWRLEVGMVLEYKRCSNSCPRPFQSFAPAWRGTKRGLGTKFIFCTMDS